MENMRDIFLNCHFNSWYDSCSIYFIVFDDCLSMFVIYILKHLLNSFLQVSHSTSYIIGFPDFLPIFFRLTLRLPWKLHPKNPTLCVKSNPKSNPLKNVKTLGMTGFESLLSWNLTLLGKKSFSNLKNDVFYFFEKVF